MLQDIREKTQSWFAAVVIIFVCLSFALWGIHNYVTGKDTDEAAVVNGKSISVQQIDLQYQRLRKQQQAQQPQQEHLPISVEEQLKQRALDEIISQQVLVDVAKKQGYYVTDQQIKSILATIPAFQVEGVFNQNRFQEVINDISYTPQGFVEDLQRAIILEQVRKGLTASAFLIPDDVIRAVQLIDQRRDFSYVVIPSAYFKNQIKVSNNDIQQYYNQHPQLFNSPEQVKIQYVELTLASVLQQIKVSDSELKQYYQDNIATFTKPQRWHVAQILIRISNQASANDIAAATKKADLVYAQINAGNNFAALAKQYSDDLISARVGGEMGWMTASNLESGYLRAIAPLKAGQSSKPVRTPYGFVIFHVDAMEPAQVAPFQSVSNQIMTTLKNQRAEQTFFDQREQLANLAFANPNSLDVAARTLNIPIQATDSFSRQGTKEGITANKNVIAAAYSADVLNGHDNSQLVEVTPDRVIVLRVTDHQKASQIPINNVIGQIKTQLIDQYARLRAKQQAEKMVNLLNQGQTLSAVSQPLRLSVITKKDIKRNNKELAAEMIKQVFRMPKPKMSAQQITYSNSAFALPSGDYVVAQLNRVQDGHFSAANEQERRYLDDQLETSFGQLDYAFYVQSAMKNADIEIKHDEIKSPSGLNTDEENPES